MNSGRFLLNTSALLLRAAPRPVKHRLRGLAPQWGLLAIRRIAQGGSPFREAGFYGIDDDRVGQLEQKLWGGFSAPATAELEALRQHKRTPRRQAAVASLVLARFYAAGSDYERALECLAFGRSRARAFRRDKKVRLIGIHCLLGLGRWAEARRMAEQALADGKDSDGCLNAALASVAIADGRANAVAANAAMERWFACLSRPLLSAELAGLALRDPTRPLALDNLAASMPPPMPDTPRAPKVSVLMAVYNGRENLEWAMRAVLGQTWRNLELVLVDDASTDGSWQLIQRLAAEDSRIVPIRQSSNGGAYVARNTALARASGEFVTVNDADDWSHPQKIEAQVTRLLEPDAAPANVTDLVRVTPDMAPWPRLDSPYVPIVNVNYSSLMLRRDTAVALGGWDAVRMSADSEFIERLRLRDGESAVENVAEGVPLSLSLVASGSLTAASATNIRTHHFGARQAYARQSREWHQAATRRKIHRASQLSPFPVPAVCYYSSGQEQTFDVIVASDFGVFDGRCSAEAAYLASLCDRGFRVGILPWPCYESTFTPGADSEIARHCRRLEIVTLVHGEKARCDLLSIRNPRALMHRLDRLPEIEAQRVTLLSDRSPSRRYDPETVQETSVWAFGKRGEWV
jgi:tetratricopeptide (TPR) repeat protein